MKVKSKTKTDRKMSDAFGDDLFNVFDQESGDKVTPLNVSDSDKTDEQR